MTKQQPTIAEKQRSGGHPQPIAYTSGTARPLWHCVRDASFALRYLCRHRWITAVTVAILSIGLGATISTFAMVNALFFHALPLRDADRLVRAIAIGDTQQSPAFSYRFYEQFRRDSQTCSGVAVVGGWPVIRRFSQNAVADEASPFVMTEQVSGNYFEVVQPKMQLGRGISDADDIRGNPQSVIVISDALWSAHFNRSPAVLGTELTIENHRFTIIGVVSSGFRGIQLGTNVDAWVPIGFSEQIDQDKPWKGALNSDAIKYVHILARRKVGFSNAQVQTEINTSYSQYRTHLRVARPSPQKAVDSEERVQIDPAGRGYGFAKERFRKPIIVAMCAVAMVLLITCANVAGLGIATGLKRQGEFALRLAIGAQRSNIIRQLCFENLFIALLGGVIAIGIAFMMNKGFISVVVPWLTITPDATIYFFSITLCCMVGLVTGIVPAVKLSSMKLWSAMKADVGRDGAVSAQRVNTVLVVSQIALSVVVLIGAGLFTETLRELSDLDLGYRRKDLILANVEASKTKSPDLLASIYGQIVTAVESIASVRSAAYFQGGLQTGIAFAEKFSVVGAADDSTTSPPTATVVFVGGDFFKTLGIGILNGRTFTRDDENSNASPAIVINERAASRLFGGTPAIGRYIVINRPYQIVGVVKDARLGNIKNAIGYQFYIPFAQRPNNFSMTIAMEVGEDTGVSASDLKALAGRIDAGARITAVRGIDVMLDQQLSQEKLVAKVTSYFGGFALILAVTGLFSLLLYYVLRRRRELAIRVALGALPGDISRLLFGHALRLTVIGYGCGVLLAIALGRLAASLLYGATAFNVQVYAVVAIAILIAALMACALPVLIALKIDPQVSLRGE